ncbi:MAG: hypothetical protein IKS61_00330, partial [Aeriscardovia sp.]|nr:hypothetical protein [Aeriscardovia sp.]
MKRGKKIWALLAAGAALVGCMGLSGTADAASLPKAQASSSQEKARASLQWKALKAEEKKILAQRREEEEKKKLLSSKKEEEERLQEERKEARGLEKKGKRQANLLETSPSGETTQNASVIGGGEWSGGVANPDTASVSSSPSPSIPSSNSITLQVSSPLYWVPFYFEGGSLPATSSGSLDEAEVKNWVLSGNFASGAYIGLQDTSVLQAGPFVQGAGAGSVSKANGGPGFQFPFFGGVDPETGKLVSGGITTAPASYFVVSSSPGSQTFEAYAVSSCIDNSSLPSIGETADSLLGVSSPSPSSCLAAFQKNAEAKAEIGGASYDLLSYQGLSSLLKVLDYDIPSNPATGYQGPGYQGPVTVTVGLSPALMQLINAYNAWWGPNFSYELDVFDPDSPQEGYVSGEGAKWVFNPSLYTAHFKAVSEDGEPLKKVCVSIQTDFNYEDNLNFNDEPGVSDPEWWSWNLYLVPGYWDPENINSSTLNNYYNNYASAYDSLGVPPSSPPYKQFGWINSTNTYGDFSWEGVTFILNCVPGEPGEFELPKLPTGTYFVYLFEWGSAYAEDGDLTLSLSLGGSGGETIAAQDDPDGCVNSSTQTVVMETHNPFAEVLNSKGGAEESQSIPLEYGKGHTFTYQLQTYLPYSAPFSVSFNPGSSYGIDLN